MMAFMTTVIYPGSFDPLTNGHIDIMTRASKMFDKVIVAVSNNLQKNHLFTLEERIALVKSCVPPNVHIEVDAFSGLLVDYARSKQVKLVLRGLRAVSDFEYEFHLASANRKLAQDIETIFLMTGETSYFVSSRLVREIASFSGDVSTMVPKPVQEALEKKMRK